MLKPEFTGQFKKDYKLAVKRGCDPQKLSAVVELLCEEKPLPSAYRDHALTNSVSLNWCPSRDNFALLQPHTTVDAVFLVQP